MTLVRTSTLHIDDTKHVIEGPHGEIEADLPLGRIEVVDIGGNPFLVMSASNGGFGGSIGLASISGSARVTFQGAYFSGIPEEETTIGGGGLASIEKFGKTFVYVTGFNGDVLDFGSNPSGLGISTLSLTSGEPRLLRSTSDPTIQVFGNVTPYEGDDAKIVSIGLTDILITASEVSPVDGGTGFNTYRIRDNGTLAPLDSFLTSDQTDHDFVVAQPGEETFVISGSAFDGPPLQVMELDRDGHLNAVFQIPGTNLSEYTGQVLTNLQQTYDITSVTIEDRAFIYASSIGFGSLVGFEVLADGSLQLVENQLPQIGEGWQSAKALETFEQNGRHFLAAGSEELGIFEISDGGALTLVEQTSSLPQVRDLEVLDIGTSQYIITANQLINQMVTSFRFRPEEDRIFLDGLDNDRRGTDTANQIFAKGGDDEVRARGGDDLVEGNNGNDVLYGMDGNDHVFGGKGDDEVYGGTGRDFVFGENGRDLVRAGQGDDIAYGNNGQDKVFGDEGNDLVDGGANNDLINGGENNDRLIDGSGQDRLFGGTGADVFELVLDGDRDVIRDFELGLDKIDLTRWSISYDDLDRDSFAGRVTLTYMDEEIELRAMFGFLDRDDLTEDMFIFA